MSRRRELTQWYANLDKQIRSMGGEAAIRSAQPGIVNRATSCGVPFAQVERILGRLKSFADWPSSWSEAGDQYRKLGEDALGSKNHETAARLLVLSSYCYFYAQRYLNWEDQRKSDIASEMVATFRIAADLMEPPALAIKISYRGIEMAGYLRIPRSAAPAPCVVMIDGADTVKEELHFWTEQFIERGLATLTFDGPGQGETNASLKMDEHYSDAVTTVIDYLNGVESIDSDRIVIWGVSLGGYLAAQCLIEDTRPIAGVCLGGFYDMRNFTRWTPTTKEAFQQILGQPDVASTQRFVEEHMTLHGRLSGFDRPLLVVHGGLDHLVSTEEIRQFALEAPDVVDLWIYEDRRHALWDHLEVVGPLTADWVRSRAGSDR